LDRRPRRAFFLDSASILDSAIYIDTNFHLR
jgi:hypothetical protein